MANRNLRGGNVTRLFCFGLGYTAGVLARRMTQKGWTVAGTATSPEGAAALNAQGLDGVVFDGKRTNPAVAAALGGATHGLLSIPPVPTGDPAFASYADAMARSESLAWVGYLSTIGVYGDAKGGWIDEDTPARPASERGRLRLAAETQWQAFGASTGKCVMVFRLPAIYGPGRSAIDDLRAGRARRVVKPGQVFNRIHVADLASALAAAMAKPRAGRVYNVTDDEPAPPQDVVAFAAELLGLPPPPELAIAASELSAMAKSFYSENKRVKNDRMKKELGVHLAFPTYREGLKALAGRRE